MEEVVDVQHPSSSSAPTRPPSEAYNGEGAGHPEVDGSEDGFVAVVVVAAVFVIPFCGKSSCAVRNGHADASPLLLLY